MKVLITGACGFIGRVLIDELGESHDLTLLDRVQPSDATTFVPGSGSRPLNLCKRNLPFIQAELTDAEAMRAAIKGQDAIVNLAGSPYGNPEIGVDTFRTNALGTFVVLDAARLGGVKRVLCASSINAFGTFYHRLSGKPVSVYLAAAGRNVCACARRPLQLEQIGGRTHLRRLFIALTAWSQPPSALPLYGRLKCMNNG